MSSTITNVQTLSEAFVQWLEEQDIATFGQDLYINEVPSSSDTQDSIYWILTSGGSPISKNQTGETIRMNMITVNYRSISGQDVEKKLYQLNELLTCPGCMYLSGFEIVDLSVSQYPATSDMDLENRKTGFLRINIQTYKKEC